MQEHILHSYVKKRRWDNGEALLNGFSFLDREWGGATNGELGAQSCRTDTENTQSSKEQFWINHSVCSHETGLEEAAEPSLQAAHPEFSQTKPGQTLGMWILCQPHHPGWNKIRTQQATKPGIAQGSNLFLVSFSPFPSQLHQGWIWIWRSQMSWQDPHEHKAVSSGRKSSWEVPEPQTLACPVKLSTWNLGKGKY